MTNPSPPSPPKIVSVEHGNAAFQVWFDATPGFEAVIVEVEEFAQEIHIPLPVARQVVDAISQVVVPTAFWSVA